MTRSKRLLGITTFLLCLFFNSVRAQEVLTNQSLIQMSQMKVSSGVIIAKIRASKNDFDLTTNGLLQLLAAKVQSSVLDATLQGVSLADVMTNEDVIKLWDADLSRKLLIQKINVSRSRFDVTTSGLIQLKTGHIPDQIVKVMMVAPTDVQPVKPPGKQQPNAPARQAPSTMQPTNQGNSCAKWTDKFTKKSVTVARVLLRGRKAGNILLGHSASTLMGIEDMEVTLLFRRDDKETVLVMYASKPGFKNLVVTRDKPLLLLMNDESVMEFKPIMDAEYGVNFDYTGYSVSSNLCVYYAINRDQLHQLSTKIVKAYRLHTYNKDYREDTVNQNRAEQVQEAARCILD